MKSASNVSFKKPHFALLSLIFTVSLATPSLAIVYSITVTGTLSSGFDNAGIFGPARANLQGKPFSIAYTLTEPVSGTVTISDTLTNRDIVGSDASNPLLGSLTVNGITRQVQPLQGRYTVWNNNPSPVGARDLFSLAARSDDFDGAIYYDDWIHFDVSDPTQSLLSSTALPSLLFYTAPGALALSGNFRFQNSAAGYLASGEFLPTSFSITSVPEPTSSAILLVGAGLFCTKRRRSA